MIESCLFLSSCQLKIDSAPLSLGKLLDLQDICTINESIQVGTFIATIDFEEGKSMTDSHLPASKRTIMVVDDNPDLVDILRIMLESKGFNVRCAYSGKDLFAGLEEQKPDLILLDIMMPQMDGLEVLTRLKSYSNSRPIPVILLTAKQPDEAIFGGYDIWADSYITKPFTNPQLLNVINRLIGEA